MGVVWGSTIYFTRTFPAGVGTMHWESAIVGVMQVFQKEGNRVYGSEKEKGEVVLNCKSGWMEVVKMGTCYLLAPPPIF